MSKFNILCYDLVEGVDTCKVILEERRLSKRSTFSDKELHLGVL